ncbi:GNAT family N-acetyltransferase [Leisingera sp. D0M16]|uniref:GNAT family N-acetyltransferase n=1 Tax=Leisingera coralii TaxID=3351347 RepID=UPI003B77AB83
MNSRAVIQPAPPEALEARVLTRWEEFAALEAEWRAMHAACRGRLFSSFDWLAAQHAGFGLPGELRIFTIWQARRMVAAAPMCLVRKRFSMLLPFFRPRVLTGWLCSHSGFYEFLATSRETLRALLDAVCRAAPQAGIELAVFRVCTRDVFTTRCLRLGGLSLWQDRVQARSLAENLSDWDSYCQTRSRAFRKKLRNGERQLQRAKAETEVFRTADNAPVQRVFALAERSPKQRPESGLAGLRGGAFLSELWHRFAARDSGALILMRAGEQDIASFCAVRCKDTWYCLAADCDTAFSELSPRRSILCQGLQALIGEGTAARIDFGRRSRFLKDFETSSYQVRRLRGVRRGSRAHWLLKLEDMLRKLTRLRGLLPHHQLRRADALNNGGRL